MNQTLYCLCRHAVGIMDGWHPYPARLIAEQTKVSVSTTRKRLRELKKQGLVELICEAPESEDESSLPYWGWTITERAEKTKEYKMAQEEERKICQKVFGKGMFPDNPDAKGDERCV